ncbi:hypothetical protein [Candidatus Blastococcus massiliensis]|uniref:hypothetical protein n=1 Tax=Candidatus Blastococcus massiliensis TaxID=1470358 RepID=UPI0012DF835C|nr:hypothetical protein [Candidatus Blastococcus massiliensis]
MYRALLGRAPDPEGLAHWSSTSDLEVLVKAVSDTGEHQQRVRLLAALAGDGRGDDGVMADVGATLAASDGLAPLDDPFSLPSVLRTLPWHEVADPWGELPALVLGPYAQQLSAELVGREVVNVAYAGLSGAAGQETQSSHGTLVLTDELYVSALARVRRDIIDGTLLRLLHPVPFHFGESHDERQLAVLGARRRLHRLGFIEVSHVFGRRHGGEPVVVDTSFAMPVPGEILTVPRTTLPEGKEPMAAWLVARRVPVEDQS